MCGNRHCRHPARRCFRNRAPRRSLRFGAENRRGRHGNRFPGRPGGRIFRETGCHQSSAAHQLFIIEVAPQYIVHLGKTREAAIARFQQTQMCKHLDSLKKSTLKEQGSIEHHDINLIGTPEQVIERAHAFGKAGVTHLLGLYFAANSIDELCDQMEWFARDVMPHIV